MKKQITSIAMSAALAMTMTVPAMAAPAGAQAKDITTPSTTNGIFSVTSSPTTIYVADKDAYAVDYTVTYRPSSAAKKLLAHLASYNANNPNSVNNADYELTFSYDPKLNVKDDSFKLDAGGFFEQEKDAKVKVNTDTHTVTFTLKTQDQWKLYSNWQGKGAAGTTEDDTVWGFDSINVDDVVLTVSGEVAKAAVADGDELDATATFGHADKSKLQKKVQGLRYNVIDETATAKTDVVDLNAISDEEAAAKAAALIDALIDAVDKGDGEGGITAADEPAIAAAREAYDALPAAAKESIQKSGRLATLEAAEATLAAAEQAPIDAVTGMLGEDGIPAAADVSTDQALDIYNARAAYNNLTAAQKAKVPASALARLTAAETALSNINTAAARIAALPAASNVTLDNAAAIQAARAAYNSLSEKAKNQIDATKLIEAEAALLAAQEAAEIANGTAIDENETALSGNTAATSAAAGCTLTALEGYLANLNSDEPAGTEFGKLRAKAVKTTKKSVKIQWTKVKGATSYVIYANKCGKKNKFQKVATVKSSKKAYTAKKIAGKKVAKNTNYKILVVAVKGNTVVSTAPTIHVATKAKNANYKKVTLKSTKQVKKGKKVTLKAKKSVTLKAKKYAKTSKKSVKVHRKLRFESSNAKVAKVNAKTGKVTAVKKGKATVYAYTQNGVFAKVAVTVK